MDRRALRFRPVVDLLEDRSTPAAAALAAGAAVGSTVDVLAADGSLVRSVPAFESAFAGGVRAALADVTGDGVPDVIAGSGPGRPATVRVFDGATGGLVGEAQPFGAGFTGGVYVAAGDLNADGKADVVVTPDQGGGPRVVVLRGGDLTTAASFYGIDDPNFRGGARAAVGDVNRDGTPDLIVAAGFGGGPRVAGFDGRTVLSGRPARLFGDFFAFEPGLRNGTYPAVGDVDGDGYADLIAGGGPGGGPRVLALSGKQLVIGQTAAIANFFAGPTSERNGVPVAAGDLDGDGRADVLAGSGTDAYVRVYPASKLAAGDTTLSQQFNPFPGLPGGVYVAGVTVVGSVPPVTPPTSPPVAPPPPASPPAPSNVVVVGDMDQLTFAVNSATPGTEIRLRPGVYAGGQWFGHVHGTAGNEIVITADDPNDKPVIRGGANGLQFSEVSYLQIRNLVFEGYTDNGINIDDLGNPATPSHHVTLSGLTVRNAAAAGNRDGIKLSGVDQFVIADTTVTNWGTSGSGIDVVGSHDGLIENTTFRHTDPTAVNGLEVKGGSARVVVRGNRFETAGTRAIQVGGYTDRPFFRPQPAPGYEARDVTVEGNVVIGSETAVAFVNADGATARFNTIYNPGRWPFRILQENTDPGFVPSRNGVVTDNIVAFSSARVQAMVNVGGGTAPATFQFARNWWYCFDAPALSTPVLPTAEVGGTVGVDPKFVSPATGDLRLQPGSPAANAGAYSPLLGD